MKDEKWRRALAQYSDEAHSGQNAPGPKIFEAPHLPQATQQHAGAVADG